MWRFSALLLALTTFVAPTERSNGRATSIAADSLNGRWDIVVRTARGNAPSWLEVESSGRDALVGRFVGIVGSARPISRIEMRADSFHFAIPHQWEDGSGDLVVDGRLTGGRLTGKMTFPDNTSSEFTATRAPALRRTAAPVWGAPVRLLHASDLAGWHATAQQNQWEVKDGVLRSPKSGANIVSDRTFGDFKLHLEFRYPAESNSGVYLRGRHEVQVQDDLGHQPSTDAIAGIYGFIAPSEVAARKAGEWQSYDITLIGRQVTVVLNGRRVICEGEIPGITGGALDSDEGAPGPIMLQGDHGPIEYRNIVVTPAR